MRQNRNPHSTRSDEPTPAPPSPQTSEEVKESGVVPANMVRWLRQLKHLDPWLPHEDPPWSVVEHYLTYRAEEAGIEDHARHSRAFAFVLETLRNQAESAEEIDPDEVPESG